MQSLSIYPGYFSQTGINYPKIYMEIQNILNNQSNFEKGKKKKLEVSCFLTSGLSNKVSHHTA